MQAVAGAGCPRRAPQRSDRRARAPAALSRPFPALQPLPPALPRLPGGRPGAGLEAAWDGNPRGSGAGQGPHPRERRARVLRQPGLVRLERRGRAWDPFGFPRGGMALCRGPARSRVSESPRDPQHPKIPGTGGDSEPPLTSLSRPAPAAV